MARAPPAPVVKFAYTLASFVAQVPLRFTAKQSLVVFFFGVLASKVVHAILAIVLTKKYDNTQASYRSGGGKRTAWTSGRLRWSSARTTPT